MAHSTLTDVLLRLRKAWAVHESRDLSDGDLLERFLTGREDAAFAVLVHRHGPMVLSVCQRVLGDVHAAEDAFQATFMVLVRRAGAIRKQAPLARWLYAVAQRLAMRARAQTAARRRRESQYQLMPMRDQLDEVTWQELRSVLDEEIVQLPRKYQAAIVLCYLEDKSHDQAAKELGCPKTTLTSRLERARELLRQNLVRRGITLSGAAVVTALSQKAAAAPVAAMLTLSTVKAANSVAAGGALAGAGLSAGAVVLVEQALKAVFWMKATVLLLVLLLGLAVGAGGLAGYSTLIGKSALPIKAATPLPVVQAAPAREQDNEAEKLFRAMEKKIMAAKSLKVVFDFELGAAKVDDFLRGNASGWFAESNKALLELEFGNMGGKAETMRVVSDGKQISVRKPADGAEMGGLLKTPPRINADVALVLARDGAFWAFVGFPHFAAQDQKTDMDKEVWAKAFRLGAKDKIAQREAITIEYTVALLLGDREGDKAMVKLWIDPKTMLPLQRRLLLPARDGEKQPTMTEFYTEFVLDPPLDGKLFEILPQAKENAEPPVVKETVANKEAKKAAVLTDLSGDPLPEGAKLRLGTLRFRGGTNTRVIGFMPGGKVLASKSRAGLSGNTELFAIDFWDTASGRRLRQLPVPRGEATAVAFSPDGKLLLTSLPSLVDVATGQDLGRLNGFGNEYNMVAFSPDGRRAAAAVFRSTFSGNDRRKVLLWDVASGDVICRLEGHTMEIWALVFSPDGKTLATACEDKKVRLWDVASSKELWQAEGHDAGLNSIAFSPDGKVLAAAGADGAMRLLDAKSGNLLQALTEPGGILRVVAFSPDGKLLATGGDSGSIVLWDMETGKELRKWLAHAERITTVFFSPDSKIVVSGGRYDHAIRQWDAASGNAINPPVGHTGAVDRLYFTADGKRLFSLGWDSRLLEWDLTTGRNVGRLFPGPLGSSGAGHMRAASQDGKMVALSSHATFGGKTEPVVHLVDTATGKEIRALSGWPDVLGSFCFSPDGKLLASSGKDGIRLGDVGMGKQSHLIEGAYGSLTFSPDSKQLASASNGKVSLWDAATGKEVRSWLSRLVYLSSLAFSHDGKLLAATDVGSYHV